MKIQTVSNFVTETYNLDCGSMSGMRYTAQKLPLDKDHVQIIVDANSCRVGKEQTVKNAHVFAYWVKIGKLACDRGGKSVCLSQ